MTAEQKEAIKICTHYKNILYACNCEEGTERTGKAIETVLNLIQEKDKEIEKYKKLYQKALNDAVVTAHDNMHKDKIIDELAKAFKQDDVRSVEEIKQYFEKQAKENEGNNDNN